MTNDELVVSVGSRVWETASANGRNIWKAANAVARALSTEERTRLLVWACVQAERIALQRQRPVEAEGHRTFDTQSSGAPLNRRRAVLEQQDPADFIVAIANTGERKRLGDLTHRDAALLSAYNGALRETYAAKAVGWRRIAEKIRAEQTLGDVLELLSARDWDFLHDELGVAAEPAL